MSKKLTTEEFIRRAKEVHGDKYDYSLSEYTGIDDEIFIVCPIHGKFKTTPYTHLKICGCAACSRAENGEKRRKTKTDFIKEAKSVHGDKYDYSKSKYIGNSKKICIICPEHGEFWQRPFAHLKGQGCPLCYALNSRKGIMKTNVTNECLETKHPLYKLAYYRWVGIIHRTKDEKNKSKFFSYRNCKLCDEWLEFECFFNWFKTHYKNGWEIDKDIIDKNSKLYSPQTCCFVPKEINQTFVKAEKRRGCLPIGVILKNGKYLARISKGVGTEVIGSYDNIIDAFNAYKKEKELRIKQLADKWKKQLEPRAYDALYNYKVEITD